MTTHSHRKTHYVKVDRQTLSPFAESAISQLLPEVWKNSENKKQAVAKLRRVKNLIQIVIDQVRSEKWWKAKKPQKRSPVQMAKRQAWFDAQRREVRDEPNKPLEYDEPEKTLEQFIEDNRARPLPPKPPAPQKSWEQIQRETCDHADIERYAAAGEKWAQEMLEESE